MFRLNDMNIWLLPRYCAVHFTHGDEENGAKAEEEEIQTRANKRCGELIYIQYWAYYSNYATQ